MTAVDQLAVNRHRADDLRGHLRALAPGAVVIRVMRRPDTADESGVMFVIAYDRLFRRIPLSVPQQVSLLHAITSRKAAVDWTVCHDVHLSTLIVHRSPDRDEPGYEPTIDRTFGDPRPFVPAPIGGTA